MKSLLLACVLLLTSCEFSFKTEKKDVTEPVKLCVIFVEPGAPGGPTDACYWQGFVCETGVTETQRASVRARFSTMRQCE
jgi:hypothetical protein